LRGGDLIKENLVEEHSHRKGVAMAGFRYGRRCSDELLDRGLARASSGVRPSVGRRSQEGEKRGRCARRRHLARGRTRAARELGDGEKKGEGGVLIDAGGRGGLETTLTRAV
jgi:hypothetical protein